MSKFTWREEKNETNRRKHKGLTFEIAELVFQDPHYVAFVGSVKDGEERWHAIGMVEGFILLVVIHTYQTEDAEELIHIISCRHASKHERRLYEDKLYEETR